MGDSFKDLAALVKDTMFVTEQQVLEAMLDDEMENFQVFVKLTEEDRRERNLRLDLGEAGAKLKISHQGNQHHGNQKNWQQGGQKPWGQQGGQQKTWGKGSSK